VIAPGGGRLRRLAPYSGSSLRVP